MRSSNSHINNTITAIGSRNMTQSATMSALASAQSPSVLLAALKDLKNSVIGNTWKKVEVAEDEAVMQL